MAPLYHERFRPQVHYSPRANWLNDPNGLVYVNGVYHLFYQHNPLANEAGNLSWGHAQSRDLLHWHEQSVALPMRGDQMIFSGSAVTDWHNTSGLGNGHTPPIIALYTGHTDHYPPHAGLEKKHHQAQFLAYSQDGAQTWHYGAETPVLDLSKHDFRDPKVFWDAPRGRWVMLVVHPDERQIEFYASGDLQTWTPLSTFGPAGEVGGIWEVPELFSLRVQAQEYWVLKVDYNPGGPYHGSAAQYWVGDFDGARFTPLTPARPLDNGMDFYAALSWSDLPASQERRVWLGWMNNWHYAHHLPTHPWRGAMSLPREVGLTCDLALTQQPIGEVRALRRAAQEVRGAQRYALGGACELVGQGTEARLLAFSEAGLEVSVTLSRSELQVARPGHFAQVPDFGGVHAATLPSSGPRDLHLLLDSSSLEVFAAGGQVVFTELLLPAAPITRLEIQGDFSGQLYALEPVWPLV